MTYAPETVTNYELGWKSLLLERSLALSLDLFNMEYKNMQVSAIEHDLTGNPTPVTINAAKARIKGAEFELDWRVTETTRSMATLRISTRATPHFPTGSTHLSILTASTIASLAPSTRGAQTMLRWLPTCRLISPAIICRTPRRRRSGWPICTPFRSGPPDH